MKRTGVILAMGIVVLVLVMGNYYYTSRSILKLTEIRQHALSEYFSLSSQALTAMKQYRTTIQLHPAIMNRLFGPAAKTELLLTLLRESRLYEKAGMSQNAKDCFQKAREESQAIFPRTHLSDEQLSEMLASSDKGIAYKLKEKHLQPQ